jgi:rsbT co-antagonist protein RsbR
LTQLLREQTPAILSDWRERLLACGGSYVQGITPAAELASETSALLRQLIETLASGELPFEADPLHPLSRELRATAEVRAARGFTPVESLQYLQCCKQAMLGVLAGTPLDGAARSLIESLMDRCVQVLFATFVATREEVIRRQADSLREVSTPVITLWDSMLLLPLVGIVDSVRAQQLAEDLLAAISQSEAEVTLIDVTGVPVMDTSVASHLLRTVTAAEMLGTRVILTGIGPGTAQTMVKLGIDMSGVPTRASLKAGLALALTLTGRRISERPAQALG